MKWVTIRNVGNVLEESNLGRGVGLINARSFLSTSSKLFIKSCEKYYNFVEEFPFVYGEKQMNSILLPVFAKNSDATFMEQPISRIKKKNKILNGWLDYWIAYKSTIFLVELKHSWISWDSGKINKVAQGKWQMAIQQIKRISAPEAESLKYPNYNVVKIALMIIPAYQTSRDRSQLTPRRKKKDAELFHRTIINQFEPSPNWSLSWILSKNLQVPIEYDDGRFEIYPQMNIAAYVDNFQYPAKPQA